MRNFILSTIILNAAHFCSYSQKTAIGFQGGVNFSNVITKADGKNNSSGILPGATAGLMMDLILSDHFSYQLGLNFTHRGGVGKATIPGCDQKIEMRLNYFELPATILYYSKSKEEGLFAGTGINLGLGTGGKVTAKDSSTSGSSRIRIQATERVSFGTSETDHLKDFDLGFHVTFGYALKNGLFFCISQSIGLANLSTVPGFQVRNNSCALKLGYIIKHNQ